MDIDIRTFVELQGVPFITNTVTTTWIIMIVMFAASMSVTRKLNMIPGTAQQIAELLMEGIHWLVDNTMGEDKMNFAPFILALSLFILISNFMGLIAVRHPTADLNTTFALAGITFLLVQYHGLRAKKLNYIKGFFQPLPFLFPLNLISELALPISLSFRLFGNMLGSIVIMIMMYMFVPILVPIIGHIYFDLFIGLIQTFIFVMLTMTFITLAMD